MTTKEAPAAVNIIDCPSQPGSDGMPVARPFAGRALDGFDPFINFVHFGPRPINETNWGFPAHPHKGFETITYMLDGQLEHHDSQGGHAILSPGDVQWMTAGRGIIHSELPPDDFQHSGGLVHGFQIWLNLKAANKSTEPGFQMLRAEDMPVERPAEGVELRVIARADGPMTMLTPIEFIHARIAPGATWHRPVTPRHRALFYVVSGEAAVTKQEDALPTATAIPVRAGQLVEDVSRLDVAHSNPLALAVTGKRTGSGPSSAPVELLYLSGRPLCEPVVGYGPFVMNTAEEIAHAVREYQSGQMGAGPV